jgi:hypothetical protein
MAGYLSALKIEPAADPVRYIALEDFMDSLPPTTVPERKRSTGVYTHMLCDSAWVMFHNDLRERSLLRGFLAGSTPTDLAECVAGSVTVVFADSDSDTDA